MPIGQARLRISDYNDTRKKKKGAFERGVRNVSLSLTSMVDMFAILVIFLIAQSDSNQWLSLSHGIDLPHAKVSAPPPRGATLQIAKDGVHTEKAVLTTIEKIMEGPDIIESVKKYLGDELAVAKKKETYLNVVADQKIPFGAVRRIIASAQAAGYTRVNLAVQPHAH